METRPCVHKRSAEENKERRTVGMGKFHRTRQCRPPRLFRWLWPLNNFLQVPCSKKPGL
jgi:hypothetical protein